MFTERNQSPDHLNMWMKINEYVEKDKHIQTNNENC